MAKQASQEKHQKHDRQVDAEKQPILSHLMALRSVLIVSLGAVAVGFLIAYYAFLTPLMNFITKPITDRGIVIIYTAVSEALTTQLKVSLMAGVVLASPVIFYKLWSFFKPALYEHEIAIFRTLFFVALFLFLLGWCSATSSFTGWQWTFSWLRGRTWLRPCCPLTSMWGSNFLSCCPLA